MVIHIDQIRESGYRVDESLSAQAVDLMLQGEGHDTGFRARGPARLKAELRKVSGGVLVDGSLDVPVHAPCKRCLRDTELSLPVSFRINLVPREVVRAEEGEASEASMDRDEGGERAGTFSLDAADRDVFDGKNIDLDPIVREQVLLALPMNAVCREDCKGLCGVCGQNLNEAQCTCDARRVDPRLAALKDIKLS
ncbi:MAG: DUF177 domain-containing protein [Myxococcaceae bacterium]|nr:DUF177 domain-containing protein [Myxococcaceae bacterium]MCI0672982.1 DUF177 domain-containing protein [Myxococcaceae bacterium]